MTRILAPWINMFLTTSSPSLHTFYTKTRLANFQMTRSTCLELATNLDSGMLGHNHPQINASITGNLSPGFPTHQAKTILYLAGKIYSLNLSNFYGKDLLSYFHLYQVSFSTITLLIFFYFQELLSDHTCSINLFLRTLSHSWFIY